MPPLLKVEHLKKDIPLGGALPFRSASHLLSVLSDVNFEVNSGEIVVLAGEAGAGKTTLARSIGLLTKPSGGKVIFEGDDLARKNENALRPLRRRFQFLFSDPRTALPPQHLVSEVMAEPLQVQQIGSPADQLAAIKQALRRVGLNSLLLDRRLTALSAGQRQRVALARALTLRPVLLVCDDPTRTLPPGMAESFFKLMADLRDKDGMAFIWLVREPRLAAGFADRLGILYQGWLVEMGKTESVLNAPQHPYTQQWLGGQAGLADSHTYKGKGCPFQSACLQVMPVCRERLPKMIGTPASQEAACFLYEKNPQAGALP
ncbi:MAG: ATP-binding cassette domain-containing protein [Chloroflexi bacterium]|nr:ATP-binding cassette domain-containing protein [Chloroflexota bacterium]